MEKIFKLCRDSGIKDPEIIPLKGDFSMRRIYRVKSAAGTIIAVEGPDVKENEAFLSFRNTFEECGLNVPSFIASNEDKSVYLVSDLGDMTVKSYCDEMMKAGNSEAVRKVYKKIILKLPEIQTALYDKIDYTKCYQSGVFDRANMESDIRRFEEYFLKKCHKNYDPAIFHKFEKEIISSADAQDKNYFLYRDFQTRNIMIKDGELYFIDFQSGRKGSFYYDLASFLYSSGTYRYEGIDEDITSCYISESGLNIICDRDVFKRGLQSFAVLRIMQALGNYAYYYITLGNKSIEDKKNPSLRIFECLSKSLDVDPGFT